MRRQFPGRILALPPVAQCVLACGLWRRLAATGNQPQGTRTETVREPAAEDGRATQGSGGSAWIHTTLARRRLNELGDSHLRGVRGEVRH